MARGSVQYFTGKPCANGHLSPRNTKKGRCIACLAEKQARYREARPGNDAEIASRYRARNADLVRERDLVRYAANREKRRQFTASWQERFPEKVALQGIRRRSAQARACPSWLSKDDRIAIRSMYLEARRLSKETGIVHHVDHIEPIRGKRSCGLHVPWNLRVIPWEENLRKGNRMPDGA